MATPIGEREGLAGVAALAEASRALAAGGELQPTLEAVVRAAVRAAGAELGVVWLREREDLTARAVASASGVAAAELEGLRARPGQTVAALRGRLRGRGSRSCSRSRSTGGTTPAACSSSCASTTTSPRRTGAARRSPQTSRRWRCGSAPPASTSTTSRRRSCPSRATRLRRARPTSTPASGSPGSQPSSPARMARWSGGRSRTVSCRPAHTGDGFRRVVYSRLRKRSCTSTGPRRSRPSRARRS